MPRHTAALLWTIAAVALAACAPHESLPDSPNDGPLLSSLQATTAGDTIAFLLQVTNTADTAVQLDFATGQSFDFAVFDDEEEIWRWSEGRMFTQALRAETIAPGETRTYRATWSPPPALSGEYRVVGAMTARDHEVRQETRFRIP
jgi:hypothetical protein